ncbi:sensor histidine kinase [Aquibacillus salsiterrae]|uniref:histidine kinase n=1 Tax=Aquibacillus salsiterrae TaxID=2950439 RepID=A0A9X3WCW6_9BACI|nr:sensor histidine kinase [Aquibacillus salsiterrae]MDC3416076.1 sensor histidine kinase [Aquibacillus salsiterrae]
MFLKQFYSNLKIKDKIFFISLLLLFIFGSIGLVSFQYFTKLYEKRIYQESANMLNMSSTIIDNELRAIEDLSFQISTDDMIQKYLKSIQGSEFNYEMYVNRTNLILRLGTFASSERYISSIQIVDSFGANYFIGFDSEIGNAEIDLNQLLVDSNGANVWSNIDNENRIISARIIRQKENLSLQELGTLIIEIDMDILMDQLINLSPNRYVITQGEELFYQNSDSNVATNEFTQGLLDSGYNVEEIDGDDFLVSYKQSRYTDLTYYNFLPYSYLTSQTNLIKIIVVICLLIMFGFTIFLSRRAAQNITKPLEDLTAKMKQIEKGNFDGSVARFSNYHNDEIGQLQVDFKIMLDKINELIRENYQKQLVIKETEYKALQAQINPHFLYNTLDSINWFAKINKQEKISILAESLGNLMRNIISKKEPLITIKDELEIVHNYVTIQKYRYTNRLQFELHSSQKFQNSRIPKLSIQPIVENAIQHGLEEMITECKVSVIISEFDDDLIITVADNGPGMDEETIHSIYAGDVKSKSSGIGLNNINERIKLMFGESYGIVIDSERGAGSKISIILPFLK